MHFGPISLTLGVERGRSGFPDKQKPLFPDFWGMLSLGFCVSARNHCVFPVRIWPGLGHIVISTAIWGTTLWPNIITWKVNITCYFIFIYLLLWYWEFSQTSCMVGKYSISEPLSLAWAARTMALCMLTLCSVSELCSHATNKVKHFWTL